MIKNKGDGRDGDADDAGGIGLYTHILTIWKEKQANKERPKIKQKSKKSTKSKTIALDKPSVNRYLCIFNARSIPY